MEMALPFTRYMFEQDLLRHLIQEAKGGDVAAFEQIMQAHERVVLQFAQRILLNRDAARDAAQEVFLRLLRNLGSIDETRDLSPWLYRTTSNVCCDVLRRSKQNLRLDLLVEPADQAPNPEESLRLRQQKQLVLSALSALSAREREVIALRDLEGLAVSEVARILKIAEGTVRSQLSTGRIKIKNFVNNELQRRT